MAVETATKQRGLMNKLNGYCPRWTGRHWDSLLGSPLKSLGPLPSESGSLRFPDVNWPLVEGRVSGNPPRTIFEGPRADDRDEFASDKLLIALRSPGASPIINSEPLRLRFVFPAVLRPVDPPRLRASSFSLSASLCSNWPFRASTSSRRFFSARNSASNRSLSN